MPFVNFNGGSAAEYANVLVVPIATDGVDRWGNQQITFLDEVGESREVNNFPSFAQWRGA